MSGAWAQLRRGEIGAGRLPDGWLAFAITVAVLVVCAWTPTFSPPTSGLDPSWQSGLFMAASRGLDHGTDIVFTYGPLGFLGIENPPLWDGDLAALAMVYQGALFAALCGFLLHALRGSVGLLPAAILTYAALVVVDGPEIVLVLVTAAAMAAMHPNPSPRAIPLLIAVGATLGAITCLVKLSVGPVVVVVALLGLIGSRASMRQLALFAGLLLAGGMVLWLLAGQGLGALDDFIRNGRQLIGGYSEGFGVDPGTYRWYVPVAAVIVLVSAAAAGLLAAPNRRARILAALCVLLAGFATFKASVVRLDDAHVPVYLSTALLIWLVLPWRDSRRLLLLGGAAALAALTVHVSSLDADAEANPVSNVDDLVTTAKTLLSPTRRDQIAEVARDQLKAEYAMDERTLAALGEHTVSVQPYEIAVAWTYDLDWDPLPVIQSYAAYTPALDQLNADRVASSSGPDRILVHDFVEVKGRAYAVDDRFLGWEAPRQTVATVCNFSPVSTTDRWQVLARVPSRCGEWVPAGSAEAGDREFVPVPKAGEDELIVAEVHGVELGLLGRLKALLLRGDRRYLDMGGNQYFRITPATATDGYLLDGPPSVVGSGPFAQAPSPRRIAVADGSGDVRFDFFRVPVETSGPGSPG